MYFKAMTAVDFANYTSHSGYQRTVLILVIARFRRTCLGTSVHSSCNILALSGPNRLEIPTERIEKLERAFRMALNLSDEREITPEMLSGALIDAAAVPNPDYVPHSEKVRTN